MTLINKMKSLFKSNKVAPMPVAQAPSPSLMPMTPSPSLMPVAPSPSLESSGPPRMSLDDTDENQYCSCMPYTCGHIAETGTVECYCVRCSESACLAITCLTTAILLIPAGL